MSRNTSTESQVTEANEAEVIVYDEASGLTFAEYQDHLLAEYQAADRKGKAGIRTACKARQVEAAKVGNVQEFLAWQAFLDESLVTAKPAAAQVDYQHRAAVTVWALEMLAEMIRTSVSVEKFGFPEGFTYDEEHNEDYEDSTEEIIALANRALPSLQVKSGTKAPKGNISAHIEQVFEGVESGTFLTEAQIQQTSTSAYPEGTPKGGNVHASLFGSPTKVAAWTEKGIIPTKGTGTTPAGAVKA